MAYLDQTGQNQKIDMNQTLKDVLSSGVIQHHKDNIGRLDELVRRVNSISSRLIGPRSADSRPGNAGAPTPLAPTLLMRLEQANSETSILLNELDEAVKAIESFV